jgi:hypothetical protein
MEQQRSMNMMPSKLHRLTLTRRLTSVRWFLVACLTLAGCSQDPLVPLKALFLAGGNTGVAQISFCTDPPAPLPIEVDYFFIVDMSSSNLQGCGVDSNYNCVVPFVPEPGANPNGNLTLGAINTFLNLVNQVDPVDPYNYFELLQFNSTPDEVIPLTNNFSTIQTAVQKSWGQANFVGWSDYAAVVSNLQNQIQAIITAESQKSVPVQHQIQVIFASDQYPEILGPNNTIQQESAAAIQNSIINMESLVEENTRYVRSLTINTIYYYYADANYTGFNSETASLLQNMAYDGLGTYYVTSGGQVPNYSNFLVPHISDPYKFTDLFVHNMNTAWDGANLESASDGLMADGLRVSKGAPASHLTNGDSDGNGVRDLVEYTVNNGRICNDPNCNPANATQYQNTICSAFVVNTGVVGQVTYTHTLIPRGLFNDCELKVLNANLDGTDLIAGTDVPQDIAAVMFYPVAIQSPTNWLNAFPFPDSDTSYDRIKEDIDSLVAASDVVDLQPYAYTLTYNNQTSNLQSCYSATVSNITLTLLPSDSIRVYLVETGVQSMTPKVRMGTKTTDSNGNVTFTDGDLQ